MPSAAARRAPGGEHVETLLSPVAVEGHGHRAVPRHGYSWVWGAVGSAIRWATTSRPA